MGDISVFAMIFNASVFCLIFWGLSNLGNYFYKKKEHFSKKQYYECGFKSLSANKISINLNFVLFGVFLILYDIDFLMLYPALFNFTSVTLIEYAIFLIFIFLIILSLLYDYRANALNWQL